MRRKEFLKSMAFLTFGALFPNSKKLDYISIENFKEKISSFNSSDPKFWKLIRDQFPIPKDFTYLNTGGLGSSPFVVAHKVKEETDILDKYPTPNHDLEKWWKVKKKEISSSGYSIIIVEFEKLGPKKLVENFKQ